MGQRINTAKWIESRKRWQINVQKDGIRKTFTSSKPGRTGQSEANKKADAWLDDNISNDSAKISKLLEIYLKEKQDTTSKSNYMKINSIVSNHIKPAIGNIKISRLTEQKLQDIINKAYKKGLAKKSLQNIKAVIVEFVKFCRKCNTTTLFPENLSIPKSARPKGKKILQPEDLTKLFKCDKITMNGVEAYDECVPAYRFQVLTGLRPGELLGLKWSDIDGNILHIRRARNHLNEITNGKNENAIRDFVLPPMAQKVLLTQPHYPNSEFVFGDMTLDFYRYRWKKFCEYNDINYVSLYELRHTFVSIAKNLPQGDLKTLVGHSKTMDTLGVYGHQVQGELENISERLENIFDDLI